MRTLKRMLLFWALLLPLSYFFGLPMALDMLTKKAQTQAYEQCQTHIVSEGLVGAAGSPLEVSQGDRYCHCLSDQLVFTKADIFDMVQKKPPAALTALSKTRAEACNHDLQQTLQSKQPAMAPQSAPVAAPADANVITIN